MRPLDDAAVAQPTQDLARPLTVLENIFVNRAYLLGVAFTVADLNVSSVLYWSRFAHLDFTSYPRVADWLQRCVSRPSFKG